MKALGVDILSLDDSSAQKAAALRKAETKLKAELKKRGISDYKLRHITAWDVQRRQTICRVDALYA